MPKPCQSRIIQHNDNIELNVVTKTKYRLTYNERKEQLEFKKISL